MIDLSPAKRKYYSEGVGLHACPECGSELVEENCTILLVVKSETEKGEFMTNHAGSHFCSQCPVVVFDTEMVEHAAKIGIREKYNLKYHIAGIVNLQAIPKEKKRMELGTNDNPIPLVPFLPDLPKTIIVTNKIGRNDTCTCGSGRKYKKCCGK